MSSKTDSVPEKRGPSKLAPITVPLKIILQVSSYLVASIIIGTLIDYLGMWLDWWDASHQMQVLAKDIGYLGENFTMSIFAKPPAEVAIEISRYVQRFMTPSIYIGHQDFFFLRFVKAALQFVEPLWQNLVYSAMTVAVRCFIIAMSVSFFIIVFIVAAVDGLVERELRKEGGGVEHSQLYHHSKAWIGRVLVVSPIIYLSWPETINPSIVILPAAASFGLATYMTFFTFKKHL